MNISSQKSAYATKDANGNLTSKTNKSTNETTTYEYDAENQLIGIRGQGSGVSYRYDGLGRRIEKNINGAITRYIYDNEDILQELDTQNSILATYTHGPGIDEPISMNRAGQTYFYHTDGLGSIRQLSNSTGQLAKSYSYDSFGNLSTTDYGLPTVINPYTFTSREYDPESGLYYYRARYYDPHLGRFLQEDLHPGNTRFPQALNLYPYVENNPVTFIDPFGLQARTGAALLTPGNGCPNPQLEQCLKAAGLFREVCDAWFIAEFIACEAFCLAVCTGTGPGYALCVRNCSSLCVTAYQLKAPLCGYITDLLEKGCFKKFGGS